MADRRELSINTRELSTEPRELSITDPVIGLDYTGEVEQFHSHHHASMYGKIEVAMYDGDPEAALFEWGGY